MLIQDIIFLKPFKFRDDIIKELGVRLIVGSVQESIDDGRVAEEKGKNATRNALTNNNTFRCNRI